MRRDFPKAGEAAWDSPHGLRRKNLLSANRALVELDA
jgi:hypothetical protein